MFKKNDKERGFMKSIVKIVSTVVVLTLTACGGGSNSGAGTATIEDGIWNGQQSLTITFSSGGTAPDPTTPNIRLTVASGQIFLEKILDGQVSGRSPESTVQGDQFMVVLARDFTGENNTVCNGSQTYTGSISSSTASGTVEGTLDCTDNTGPYQQFLSGTFNASR